MPEVALAIQNANPLAFFVRQGRLLLRLISSKYQDGTLGGQYYGLHTFFWKKDITKSSYDKCSISAVISSTRSLAGSISLYPRKAKTGIIRRERANPRFSS